jgi:hypothetical protein
MRRHLPLMAGLLSLPLLACKPKLECPQGQPAENIDVLADFEVPSSEEQSLLCRDTGGTDTVAWVVHSKKDAGSLADLTERYETQAGPYRPASAEDTTLELRNDDPAVGNTRVLQSPDHLIRVRVREQVDEFVVEIQKRDKDRITADIKADFEAAMAMAKQVLEGRDAELPEDCPKGWPNKALLTSWHELERYSKPVQDHARLRMHETAKAIATTEVLFVERIVEAKAADASKEFGKFDAATRVTEVTLVRKGKGVCRFTYQTTNSMMVDAEDTKAGVDSALAADLQQQVETTRRMAIDRRKLGIWPVAAKHLD